MDTIAIEHRLLNLVQADFALTAQPFADIGFRLNIPESEVIDRVQKLEDAGIIRCIGAVLDSRKLGYRSTLVAMRVEPSRLDSVAAVVSRHPGVSHNYARSHHYNLWFTLTVPPKESLTDTVRQFSSQPGVESTLVLPALRMFKSQVFFDMMGWAKVGKGISHKDKGPTVVSTIEPVTLTTEEKAILKALQTNLPVMARPFERMAEQIGMDENALLDGAQGLQRKGVMRRYGASLNHRQVGFVANALTCWAIPAPEVESAGARIASYPSVSHCYERQVDGDWRYNVFAMIHGRSRMECEAVAARISLATGIERHISLYSTKEYKKERVHFLG